MARSMASPPESDVAKESSGELDNQVKEAPPTVPWPQFVKESTEADVKKRLTKEVHDLATKHALSPKEYCFLSLYDPEGKISSWDSDRLFSALQADNPDKKKDVFLIVVSRGGEIEPAYQIGKLCKAYSKNAFVVAVPRYAKSAATLIALGADTIHMGALGELGPIDPQLGNLPALGVKRALETIAGICQQYPGSSEALARYLSLTVTIAQIGYCERVSESAVQYAERLLSKKDGVRLNANRIAKELVYEYKDHSFVIDFEEAKEHLGDLWVVSDTPEIKFAEGVYQALDHANLLLDIFHNKHLSVVGNMSSERDYWIFRKQS